MKARRRLDPRSLLVPALLAAAACASEPPIPITYVPQAAIPASAGTPEQQASRRLNRAMGQETRQDAAQDADPYAGSMAGTPTPSSDLEVGGGNPDPAMPGVGIPFNGN